jgi:hypothetical protein
VSSTDDARWFAEEVELHEPALLIFVVPENV